MVFNPAAFNKVIWEALKNYITQNPPSPQTN